MNVEGFQADILAEPEALVRVADAYGSGGLPAVDGRRVLLIGMGSSTYASHTAAALLRARGHDAHVELASTGTPQPPAPDTLALVVSASGGSEETVEAMARHSGVSTVVAVTNRDDSELARGADVVIPVLAGPESGGIACRSYVCTLAVLLLAAGADGDAVRRAAESVGRPDRPAVGVAAAAGRPGRGRRGRAGVGTCRADRLLAAVGVDAARGAANRRRRAARPATGSTSTST